MKRRHVYSNESQSAVVAGAARRGGGGAAAAGGGGSATTETMSPTTTTSTTTNHNVPRQHQRRRHNRKKSNVPKNSVGGFVIVLILVFLTMIAIVVMYLSSKMMMVPTLRLHVHHTVDGRIWATILTGESYNNTVMIGTQILSVQRHSQYHHLTMVLPNVGENTRNYLTSLGSVVREVPVIYPPKMSNMHWFDEIFSKLNVHNMIEYDQIVVLDADVFLRKNADQIFQDCTVDFCTVKRTEHGGNGFPDPYVNGGVVVVKPNVQRYNYLVHQRLPQGFALFDFSDEAFTGELLSDTTTRPLGRTKFLDWTYNTCSEPFFHQLESCLKNSCSQYRHPNQKMVDCYNSAFHKEIKLHHHCGLYRFSFDPLCTWEENKDVPYCQLELVTEYQQYMIEINPCAVGGRNEQECDNLQTDQDGVMCQWCNDDIRCIPKEKECFSDTKDSKLLAERTQLILQDWDTQARYMDSCELFQQQQEEEDHSLTFHGRKKKNPILFYIQNVDSGKVLDVTGGSQQAGTKLQLYTLNYSPAQQWHYQTETKHLVNVQSKLVLDIDTNNDADDAIGGVVQDGSPLRIWYKEPTSTTQEWIFNDDDYTIINPTSGKAIDINYGSLDDGTKIQVWTHSGNVAQRFRLLKV